MLSDVLKGKSDTVVFCDLSEVQRDLYLRTLALPEFQLLKRFDGRGWGMDHSVRNTIDCRGGKGGAGDLKRVL